MSAAAIPQSRAAQPSPAALRIVPGILLLTGIGYLGKLTEQAIAAYGKAHHLALPNIEYVLWAILYGLIIANVFGVPAR